jgi:hypothetical protein
VPLPEPGAPNKTNRIDDSLETGGRSAAPRLTRSACPGTTLAGRPAAPKRGSSLPHQGRSRPGAIDSHGLLEPCCTRIRRRHRRHQRDRRSAVIETARPRKVKVLAGRNGILGSCARNSSTRRKNRRRRSAAGADPGGAIRICRSS